MCSCNRDLARTLRLVADGGRDAFYEGEIAQRLVGLRAKLAGGLIDGADLAAYRAEWQQPVGVEYRGKRILECPPNGQGSPRSLRCDRSRASTSRDIPAVG